MTSYKRCDRLLNSEADFTKRFYPIYYICDSIFAWAEHWKNGKSEFRAQISQADGSLILGVGALVFQTKAIEA